MQEHRDHADSAREAFARIRDPEEGGLTSHLTFSPEAPGAPAPASSRPRMAILREQGVNGHLEMAAAFDRAGFECVDVHMSDLAGGRRTLRDFRGLAAGGGFSYGDVLGAGAGWAASILHDGRVRAEFQSFFERPDTFALGVCNGCQMFSRLGSLLAGTEHWPRFEPNRSEQFEARLVMVEVCPSPSLFFAGMEGSLIPVPVAHGEGRARFAHAGPDGVDRGAQVCLRYVESNGEPATRYPANPNGSPLGVTGFTTPDGRVTIMMPHPERAFRTVQHSWHPSEWGEDGPWMRMFRNARRWTD